MTSGQGDDGDQWRRWSTEIASRPADAHEVSDTVLADARGTFDRDTVVTAVSNSYLEVLSAHGPGLAPLEGTHTGLATEDRTRRAAELDARTGPFVDGLFVEAAELAERRIRDNVDRLGAIEASYAGSDAPWGELDRAVAADQQLAERQRGLEKQLSGLRALAGQSPQVRTLIPDLEGQLDTFRAQRAEIYRAVPAAWALRDVDTAKLDRSQLRARIHDGFETMRDAATATIARLHDLDLSVPDLDPVMRELVATKGIDEAAALGDVNATAILDELHDRAGIAGMWQAARSLAIGGISVAAMMVSGPIGLGLAGLGTIAGGADATYEALRAKALDDAAVASTAGRPTVDPKRAEEAVANAERSVALAALDVALTAPGLVGVVRSAKEAADAARLAKGLSELRAASPELARLDAKALEALLPLPRAEAVALVQRLGPERLARALAQGEVAEVSALTHAFGANAGRLIDVYGVAELAQAQKIFDLRAIAPGDLAALLSRAESPTALAELCADAERAVPKLAPQLTHYLATQDAAEMKAAHEALRIDLVEGEHSAIRHGPHLTQAQLDARIKTGMTPDGMFVQTDSATTFRSFKALIATRSRALAEMKNVHGLDLSKGPGVGGNPAVNPQQIVIDYGKTVAGGRVADGPHLPIPHPSGALKSSGAPVTAKVWPNTKPVAPETTRVMTKIEWDGARWRVVQHFPVTKPIDPVTGEYSVDANVYVREK